MPSRLIARVQNAPAATEIPGKTIALERISDIAGLFCARPSGPLSAATLDGMFEQLDSAIGEGCDSLIIDLSRADGMDSAFSGLLIALRKRLRAKGGELYLSGLRPKLSRFLEALGLGDFFPVAVDVRYAIEYIRGVRRDMFPVSVTCPSCSSPLGADAPGRGSCKTCGAVISIDESGKIALG